MILRFVAFLALAIDAFIRRQYVAGLLCLATPFTGPIGMLLAVIAGALFLVSGHYVEGVLAIGIVLFNLIGNELWNRWEKRRKSISTMKQQTASGNPLVQYNLGSLYDKGEGVPQDYTQAAFWWRKAGEQGNALAQYHLGLLYDNGRGVPQDYAQAALWWRKAAEQGDDVAQLSLGDLYYEGRGVPQDYAEAALWYRKAAEQGEAEAQYNLGVLYRDGYGVPQDYAEACFWFDLASASGGKTLTAEQVAKFRDRAASHLTPAELARVQERARKWFEAHQAKPQ